MTDHYSDAIRAGAAALAKPYREPEAIRAFTDDYPTLAAARVLDAALPHMRAAIIAEGITPGPCPAVTEFGHQGPFFDGVTPEPRTLRALCDLRAGHAGQHEAEDEQWGHFRWTKQPTAVAWNEPCTSEATITPERIINHNSRIPAMVATCEWRQGHSGHHQHKQYLWDECGRIVSTDGV